jgi:hypothetical protein
MTKRGRRTIPEECDTGERRRKSDLTVRASSGDPPAEPPSDNYVGVDNELEWRRAQMARNWPRNQYGSLLTQGEWDAAQAALQQAQQRTREVQLALSEAASEINCAGPVAHRIRVLKQEYTETVMKLEAEVRAGRQEGERPNIEAAAEVAFTYGMAKGGESWPPENEESVQWWRDYTSAIVRAALAGEPPPERENGRPDD